MAVVPPETFRIYTGVDQTFFVVHIAETLAEMHTVMKELDWSPDRDGLACCWGCDSKEVPELLGVIWFNRERFSTSIVAHELTHATFRTYRAGEGYGATITTGEEEEQFCDIIQHLNCDFWTEYYRIEAAAGRAPGEGRSDGADRPNPDVCDEAAGQSLS